VNPAAFVNHHSYAIAAVAVFLVAASVLLRRRPRSVSAAALALLAVVLLVPPLYVGATGQPSAALGAALSSGRPTLLEVYSDL